MKTVIAVVMGFFSGFLLYLMAGLVVLAENPKLEALIFLVFVFFIGGWAVSSYFLTRNQPSIPTVLARGFLLGAAEWLLMIGAGFVRALRSPTVARGGIVAAFTGAVSLFMVIVCLAGFAIVYFTRQEMQKEKAPKSD